jgi:hypothetical protein
MEVNVISQEERAKVEGESYLRSRLAGFNPASETLAKHAHWTEFHCSGKLVTAIGQVRSGSVLIVLPVFQPQFETKRTPRSRRVVRNRLAQRLAYCGPVPQAIAYSIS